MIESRQEQKYRATKAWCDGNWSESKRMAFDHCKGLANEISTSFNSHFGMRTAQLRDMMNYYNDIFSNHPESMGCRPCVVTVMNFFLKYDPPVKS